jgi:endonuclease/exonuclease/phosphatase (EEP) superfamily protein YafD
MHADETVDGSILRARARRYRERRRALAARQGWWLLVGAALLVAWGRVSARSLDPWGPARLDWAANQVRALEFQVGCVGALLLLGALVRRAWLQAALAAAIVALTVGAPLVHGLGRGAPEVPPEDASTLRLLTINVLVHNDDVADTARDIREADADVVLVQEYGKAWAERLPAALEDEWRLVAAHPREDSFGVAAFVRRDRHGSMRGAIGLAAIEARELLRRVDDREGDTPVLLAGDFNAVGGSAIDQAVQRAGFRDAWELAGEGPGWTWPRNGVLRVLPGIRIDHVYVDDAWEVQRVRRLPSHGSDHRPLLVDLAVSAS